MTRAEEWHLIRQTYMWGQIYQSQAYRQAILSLPSPYTAIEGGIYEEYKRLFDLMSTDTRTQEDIYEAACDNYYSMSGDASLREV